VYKIKKDGFLGGGERTLKFNRDNTVKDVITKFDGNAVISVLGKTSNLNIRVPPGLPNTTRPLVNYYKTYNFEREEWWPKFQRTGIVVVKGDKIHKSRATNNQKPNNNNANNIQASVAKSAENVSNNVIK